MPLRLIALLAIAPLVTPSTAHASSQPALVKLPKLKALGDESKVLKVKATPIPKQAAAAARVAILEVGAGADVQPAMLRRVAIELRAAVQRVGRFKEVITIAEIMNSMPLEAQERLSDCASPSCLVELGAMLQVGAIISPRLTLEPGGFRLGLDYMDLGVEARWRRDLKGQATERQLTQAIPGLVQSLWGGKAEPVAVKAKAQPGFKAVSHDKLVRWGSVLVGVGGVAVFGTSYMVLGAAQEEYEPATATAKDYDQLASAQTQARIMWGTGLALTGAGIAGFSLLAR